MCLRRGPVTHTHTHTHTHTLAARDSNARVHVRHREGRIGHVCVKAPRAVTCVCLCARVYVCVCIHMCVCVCVGVIPFQHCLVLCPREHRPAARHWSDATSVHTHIHIPTHTRYAPPLLTQHSDWHVLLIHPLAIPLPVCVYVCVCVSTHLCYLLAVVADVCQHHPQYRGV